jgi:phosphoribosylamine--glycine ligase
MRVFVIGAGGREHALCARLRNEPGVSEVFCAPGNPGIAAVARLVSAKTGDVDALLEIARRERVDFTIVGPELPLSLGIADRFAAERRLLFGPTAAAARLESSKAFAKDFMARHRVPTARFQVCRTLDAALAALGSGEFGWPVVVKADGLAAGKGVVVAPDLNGAAEAATAFMQDRRFGDAGTTVVIEECLAGPEVSFFVISDGRTALPIGTAQDHKRIFDDDRGPNTGGMGAFAPSPLIDDALSRRIMREIVHPVISGMALEGNPFIGFLYVGLMLTAQGPRVIEFNARLGDPEAQVVLPLIAEPMLPLLTSAAAGQLSQDRCSILNERLVGVVLASRGYPESSQSGCVISGLPDADRLANVMVFHAGTAVSKGHIVTDGGRVLTVVGRGTTFGEAISAAYGGVQEIAFDGMQFRRDIGRKALAVSV